MKFPTKYNHYGYGWLEKIYQGYHPGIDYDNGKPYEDEGQEVVDLINILIEKGSSTYWSLKKIIE